MIGIYFIKVKKKKCSQCNLRWVPLIRISMFLVIGYTQVTTSSAWKSPEQGKALTNGIIFTHFCSSLFFFPQHSTFFLQTFLHPSLFSILSWLKTSIHRIKVPLLPKEKPFWVFHQSPNPWLLRLILRRGFRLRRWPKFSWVRLHCRRGKGGTSMPTGSQTVRDNDGFETRHVRGWATCTHPEVRGGLILSLLTLFFIHKIIKFNFSALARSTICSCSVGTAILFLFIIWELHLTVIVLLNVLSFHSLYLMIIFSECIRPL